MIKTSDLIVCIPSHSFDTFQSLLKSVVFFRSEKKYDTLFHYIDSIMLFKKNEIIRKQSHKFI